MEDREKELQGTGGETDARRAPAAPGGARQNVRGGTSQGAVARPGGATQNSGGALVSNEEDAGPEVSGGAD